MPRIGDYLLAEQMSRAERVSDYLTSQQLSRSERIGEFLTQQYFDAAPKLGNYLTMQEVANNYKIHSPAMSGLGCCKGGLRGLGSTKKICCNMGEVDCGGECGARIYDDPDRLLPLPFPTVGQPVPPLDNVTPGTDMGPQNNDWATDGMGDWKAAMDWVRDNKGKSLFALFGVGLVLQKLGIIRFKK